MTVELANLYAHSASNGEYHRLSDHLLAVASMAAGFASHFGGDATARIAGLLHDAGKSHPAFQEYLCGLRGRSEETRHSIFGAALAFERDDLSSTLAIAGHHGGLPDLSDVKTRIKEFHAERSISLSHVRSQIEQLVPDLTNTSSSNPPFILNKLNVEFFTRMIFSALVDADWLDTEHHFKGDIRTFVWPPVAKLGDSFFENQGNFQEARSVGAGGKEPLNILRRELHHQVVTGAAGDPGVYTMTIPTGGGKTRAALGYAFTHARLHGHRRVIVALPYTSILDQIAAEYAGIFGQDSFLPHYSTWQPPMGSEDDQSESAKARQFASENWDASLILTTTVQLFDSIFSNRPSDCRKLHRLANSIIVLDEVQALPVNYLTPIADVLSELVRNYGVTLLLSTATPIPLDLLNTFKLDTRPVELVSEPAVVYKQLKRVDYQIVKDEIWNWERVADELCAGQQKQGMVILNTKKQSLDLFDAVKERESEALYLSTYLCSAHRRRVIEEVKRRLAAGEPCLLVTTQIVEAGVDIDFPLVMRAIGPLDRIVQAAGRCNREGKLEQGRMIVFTPEDHAMPRGSYATGAGIFRTDVAANQFDPDDPEMFRRYFAELISIQTTDSKKIMDCRKALMFATTASKFRMIEDDYEKTVLVGFRPGARIHEWDGSPATELLKCKSDDRDSARARFRKLQQYGVGIPTGKIEPMRRLGLLTEGHERGLYIWNGKYDDVLGLGRFEHDPMFGLQ